jgi:hypothetical protein
VEVLRFKNRLSESKTYTFFPIPLYGISLLYFHYTRKVEMEINFLCIPRQVLYCLCHSTSSPFAFLIGLVDQVDLTNFQEPKWVMNGFTQSSKVMCDYWCELSNSSIQADWWLSAPLTQLTENCPWFRYLILYKWT